MKKKFGDYTVKEIAETCKKHERCLTCPFAQTTHRCLGAWTANDDELCEVEVDVDIQDYFHSIIRFYRLANVF